METQLLMYIILFLIYLIPQAMIINGIFLAASGTTEVRPDGKDHDSEMIFYKLNKYLQQKTMEKIYYVGSAESILAESIIFAYPSLNWLPVGMTLDDLKYWVKQKNLIQSAFDIKFEVNTINKTIAFYREYSNYKFSKYIRKPIFGCVICMSSFWGIFTFVIPGLIAYHFDPIILALYVPNTFCLAYLNYKIYKPL